MKTAVTVRPAALSSAVLSDALDTLGIERCVLPGAIRGLMAPGVLLAGRAFPMRAACGGEQAAAASAGLIRAVDMVPANAVVVIDAACGEFACWGELTGSAALARGAAGVICNGWVRDLGYFRERKFPVFARGTTVRRGSGRADIVSVNQPLVIDGIHVAPDDLVVADDDGIVVVPAGREQEVIARAAEIAATEQDIRTRLRSGASLRSAIDDALASTAGKRDGA